MFSLSFGKSRRQACNLVSALTVLAAMLGGCDSSKSGSTGGQGGHASQTSAGGSTSASAGTTSSGANAGNSGQAGQTGSAGGTNTGHSDSGGKSGGNSAGTSGSGGSGLGGTAGRSSGGTGSGGASSSTSGGMDAGIVDAGCVGTSCTRDAGSPLDVLPQCGSIQTQAECDKRSDCHSVSYDDGASCGCALPGCCMRFNRCDNGGAVACSGQVGCTQTTPVCAAPYTVLYRPQLACYEGCVLASKCSPNATCPTTAPTNGAACQGVDLSCVYQDCAGAGRTQALCQGGVWSVQTMTCDSVACKGGGTLSGSSIICGPGKICVQTTGNGGAYVITPTCATNKCGTSPVALSCVEGLTGNCNVNSNTNITCSLPMTCGGSTSCPP